MTLEDLIREATKRGLTHLSLSPTPSTDGKKIYWNAVATPSTMHKYISVSEEDPVKALSTVLQNLPKAPKRAPSKSAKEQRELDVTAAVTAEDARDMSVNPDDDVIDTNRGGSHSVPEEPESEMDKWLPKT